LRVEGEPPDGRCLFVANHRSYLDVLVLAEALRATFLSRADVADWRLVGPTAIAIGAVFVDRDDRGARARAARGLVRRLETERIIVFPEGTTTGAPLPGPFEPGLFRLLAHTRVPVIPVTLRYSRRDAYWIDDLDVETHLRTRILQGPPLVASVRVGLPFEGTLAADGDRLREAAYRAVAAPIERDGELVGTTAPS
ncbi:MAG: lysophospholipid acyltransferase family protein, partial [Candidatus Binatia bacterium]